MKVDLFNKNEINFKMLTRSQLILCFDVTGDTIDNWVELGMEMIISNGSKFYDSGKVFKWRLDRETSKIKSKAPLNDGEIDIDEAKRQDVLESLRKKRIENDESEKILINFSEANKRFSDLAILVKTSMLNIPPVISANLEGKSAFEIENRLRKEIEKSLNSLSDEIK